MAPKTPTLKQHLDPGYVGRLEAERDEMRDALNELWMAGLAMVPHMGYISAGPSIRWDEAMSAAATALGQNHQPGGDR